MKLWVRYFVFVAALGFCGSANSTKYADFVAKSYLHACSGDFENLSALKKSKEELLAFLLMLPSGFIGTKTPFQSKAAIDATSFQPGIKKLLKVNLLLENRSTDFNEMLGLLDFETEDMIVLGYKNFFLGAIKTIIGNTEEANKNFSLAIENVGFDPEVLSSILSESSNLSALLPKIEDQVNSISEENPLKPGLTGLTNYYKKSGSESDNFNLSQKSYLACSKNISVAMDYAIYASYLGRQEEAEKIFLEISKSSSNYPVYVDYLLTEIYFGFGEAEKAKAYLEKTWGHKEYLIKEDREWLIQAKKTLASREPESESRVPSRILVGVLLFVGIAIVYLIKSVRKNKEGN